MKIDLPDDITNKIARSKVSNGFLCVYWIDIPGQSDCYELNRWWYRQGGSHTRHSYEIGDDVIFNVGSGDEYKLRYPTQRRIRR